MNASKIANADPSFRILVLGLPGSGKTTFAKQLMEFFPNGTHLNADEVRTAADDWDFSDAGRVRQAQRMKDKANEAGGLVVADFVCPTPETRAAFAPHIIILPGLCISITLLGVNLLGDAVRDWLDPKMQD